MTTIEFKCEIDNVLTKVFPNVLRPLIIEYAEEVYRGWCVHSKDHANSANLLRWQCLRCTDAILYVARNPYCLYCSSPQSGADLNLVPRCCQWERLGTEWKDDVTYKPNNVQDYSKWLEEGGVWICYNNHYITSKFSGPIRNFCRARDTCYSCLAPRLQQLPTQHS